jgi:hypothetical protein
MPTQSTDGHGDAPSSVFVHVAGIASGTYPEYVSGLSADVAGNPAASPLDVTVPGRFAYRMRACVNGTAGA